MRLSCIFTETICVMHLIMIQFYYEIHYYVRNLKNEEGDYYGIVVISVGIIRQIKWRMGE